MRSFFNCLFVLAALMPGLSGQVNSAIEFDSSPPGVTLLIRTLGNQTTFHIGEVIRLELSFISAIPERYRANLSQLDRMGVCSLDHITAEPNSGWGDQKAYLDSCPEFYLGGLRNAKVLSNEPTTAVLELNQWMRFRDPETYVIVVESNRVVKMRSPPQKGQVRLHSNARRLTVYPGDCPIAATDFEGRRGGPRQPTPGTKFVDSEPCSKTSGENAAVSWNRRRDIRNAASQPKLARRSVIGADGSARSQVAALTERPSAPASQKSSGGRL